MMTNTNGHASARSVGGWEGWHTVVALWRGVVSSVHQPVSHQPRGATGELPLTCFSRRGSIVRHSSRSDDMVVSVSNEPSRIAS